VPLVGNTILSTVASLQLNCFFAFHDTKGRTLENVSEVFGDDAAHEKQQVQHVGDIYMKEKPTNSLS
jgi:hypothetical protein